MNRKPKQEFVFHCLIDVSRRVTGGRLRPLFNANYRMLPTKKRNARINIRSNKVIGLIASLLLVFNSQVFAETKTSSASLTENTSSNGSSDSVVSGTSNAPPMIVEKQVFEMPQYTTFGGRNIKSVKVGWEAYGKLNAAKTNVILITHYFSGSSHAAGKYHINDASPGYWDSVIGPGKAIDTERFYVISVDTLANLNAYDPHVITTGPASINHDTGKPYGLDFPVVTMPSLELGKLYIILFNVFILQNSFTTFIL